MESTKTFVLDDVTETTFDNFLEKHDTNEIEQQQLTNKYENVKKKKKLETINSNFIYLPKFYLTELRNSLFKVFFWLFIFLIYTSISIYFLVIFANNNSIGFGFFLLPLFVVISSFLIVSFIRYRMFYDEAKTINFKNEKALSINIQKLYKKLRVGYINVNFLCSISYIVCCLGFIILGCISWGYKKGFSYPFYFNQGFNHFFIVFLVIFLTLIFSLFAHCYLIVSNYIRYSKIDNFYNCHIIPNDEIEQLKSKIFKRDLIIFCVIIVVFGWLTWVIYKLIRNKKTAKIEVKV